MQKGSPDILKFVFTEMADEHPDADTDDVLATTESELAVSSGEAADSGTRASGTTSTVATAVAKSVGETRLLGIEVQCHGSSRTHRVACCDAEMGDVRVVLQEQENSVCLLIETLCGSELEIPHVAEISTNDARVRPVRERRRRQDGVRGV